MHTLRLLVSTGLLLLYSQFGQAAKVDTVATTSASMNKTIKAVVITPDSYTAGQAMPVVYLLHGYSGNYSDWVKKAPGVSQLADTYF